MVPVLHAELHRKTTEDTERHDVLEDVLTSTVFDTLFILEADVVLRNWLGRARGTSEEPIGPLPTAVDQEYWFWPRLSEAEPDLVLRLGNRLFIIEAKYRSGKSGADADAATAEDDEVGEADGQSIQRALDQLAREWRSCVPTADGVFVGPAGLGAAVTECAYRALIYLVDGTRWKSAQKDIKESRDREPMGRLLLLTWQDLHIVIGAYLRGGQGPPREQRWLRHLQTLLENRGLRGFVGFPWDVVRACLEREVLRLGAQPRLRAKPGSVRRFAIDPGELKAMRVLALRSRTVPWPRHPVSWRSRLDSIAFVERLAIGRRLCEEVRERHRWCGILDPQTFALLARWPRARAGALWSKASNEGTS
jgi:hypothetical protein